MKFVRNALLTLSSASLLLGTVACSSAPPILNQAMMQNPGLMRANSAVQTVSTPRAKQETPLVQNRNVKVPVSRFDTLADQHKNTRFAADNTFKKLAAPRSPFDTPFGELPFRTFNDLVDYVRYGYSTTYEDYKYMNDNYARNHFNRYINGAYRDVQGLYKASRDEMKRFIMLDVLANSIEIDSRPIPYEDVHNPPAQQEYKMFPTAAAQLMPTFGEIVSYNRNSYDVNYQRWDMYKAARYYQANYSRVFGLIMQYGPSKQEAWRMVHREISSYASY
ncbi:hypothetical protein COW36_15055 [bacterium (Candidatus Blackallbacteria) CG17_big_fil_post_rev_8_21_14_2_50_48_46]|uniref:Uncharacterized protein n=1 Tax=bacterium (Candidatus Blackallbacteria) CG17_big_fil_post_rev_8_21_14_2_50_48_46 TaxID=2014261 RepID=A0A2M7G2K0_9BACT|nr:MAG: hypothetical protein COW64_11495 [bacterium (Candidatus Blackallbacteria) CG18_big_fil_WC_8_21_14_2_50_49_26]PIW16028.1 MAG: hypothetical protein COW36_15055 [bacterium (Candidatus Blackallbacteria) CG17_big_fil_post_rev_8_21_14_2_50_48_46]PIW50440.1 MAG: hypothetical protein COW20_02770 [bacterium (Candidatus Blackallbacteria) CG13_big_fil_rev_8_21_14_2_50_49_14]